MHHVGHDQRGDREDARHLAEDSPRHRANVLEKLVMQNPVDLTRYAIRRGLVEPLAAGRDETSASL